MTSMSPDFLQAELDELRRRGLYRTLKRVEGAQGPTLRLGGREVLNLCSNNYLGIADHPQLRQAAKEAIDRYGCGSGASRLISGNMALHEELEEKIAQLKETEAALVFNSGFQANVGLISALVGADDLIFSDSLNHASIIDGCRLARAGVIVYPHGDAARLKEDLGKAPVRARKLIVTETLFSMDGDEAPLAEITQVAERFDAMLMVDEAHATGVFGPNGAGLVSQLGLQDRVPIQMGTLGKALGGFGAYIACSRAMRELLINRCRSFIFTTSLPPAVLASAIAALEIVEGEPQRRLKLWHNSRALREALGKLGFSSGQSQSQILPLIVGEEQTCMRLSERLLEKGVFVQGIRPPTVPQGTARLRVTVMATHTHDHLHRALGAFQEVMEEG